MLQKQKRASFLFWNTQMSLENVLKYAPKVKLVAVGGKQSNVIYFHCEIHFF